MSTATTVEKPITGGVEVQKDITPFSTPAETPQGAPAPEPALPAPPAPPPEPPRLKVREISHQGRPNGHLILTLELDLPAMPPSAVGALTAAVREEAALELARSDDLSHLSALEQQQQDAQ